MYESDPEVHLYLRRQVTGVHHAPPAPDEFGCLGSPVSVEALGKPPQPVTTSIHFSYDLLVRTGHVGKTPPIRLVPDYVPRSHLFRRHSTMARSYRRWTLRSRFSY